MKRISVLWEIFAWTKYIFTAYGFTVYGKTGHGEILHYNLEEKIQTSIVPVSRKKIPLIAIATIHGYSMAVSFVTFHI
jgi:hypothetical protein